MNDKEKLLVLANSHSAIFRIIEVYHHFTIRIYELKKSQTKFHTKIHIINGISIKIGKMYIN